MELETIKMSSRGQIVIPQDIREELHVREGTMFVVFGGNDTIILKKVGMPSKEQLISDLEKLAKHGRKKLESLGIREKDIPDIVQRHRGLK